MGATGNNLALEPPMRERRTLISARISDRIDAPIDIEHCNVLTCDRDEPGGARRNLSQQNYFDELTHGLFFPFKSFQFLGQNRHAQVARLNSKRHANFENFHDLFHARAKLEGALDVAARARRIHVRDGRIEGDA